MRRPQCLAAPLLRGPAAARPKSRRCWPRTRSSLTAAPSVAQSAAVTGRPARAPSSGGARVPRSGDPPPGSLPAPPASALLRARSEPRPRRPALALLLLALASPFGDRLLLFPCCVVFSFVRVCGFVSFVFRLAGLLCALLPSLAFFLSPPALPFRFRVFRDGTALDRSLLGRHMPHKWNTCAKSSCT